MQFQALDSPPNWFLPPDVYYTDEFQMVGHYFQLETSGQLYFSYEDPDGRLVWPMLTRPIVGTKWQDLISAYGYGGPSIEGDPNIDYFLSAWKSWASREGFVTAFIRFDPVSRNYLRVPQIAQYASPTVIVPSGPNVDILSNLSKRYRKLFRRGERDGLLTSVTEPFDRKHINAFARLYHETMGRLDAASKYLPPAEFWDFVHDNQAALGAAITLTSLDGRLQAAGLRFSAKPHAYTFLSATSEEGRRNGSSEFDKIQYLFHCQTAGIGLVNFGGGLAGGNDSLLEHKRRFHPDGPLAEFHVGKVIFQPEIYANLSRNRAAKTSFFPAYRAPDLPGV